MMSQSVSQEVVLVYTIAHTQIFELSVQLMVNIYVQGHRQNT